MMSVPLNGSSLQEHGNLRMAIGKKDEGNSCVRVTALCNVKRGQRTTTGYGSWLSRSHTVLLLSKVSDKSCWARGSGRE